MNMKKWMEELRETPVKKAMPVLSFPSVQLMGISVKELISSSDLQADGMKRIADRVDSAASVSMMDLSVEAEAFGSTVKVSDDEVPTVVGRIVETEEDAEALAQSYYENLPVQQGYALSRIEKYDEELWSFCFSRQVTQTLFNPYEEVRVVVDLTTGRLVLCNVFFFPLLDDHEADDVPLTQEQAIEAAKEQSGMEMEGFELKQAEVCCVLPNWFYTEGVWSADVRYAGVSRLAWVLTYEDNGSEIVSQNIFYVDYYTGELIGGDAV